MSEINLVAFITPKGEFFHECLEAINEILALTRAEAGCLRFECYTTSDQIVLIERFISEEALQQHYAQPYTQNVFTLYERALAKPVSISKLLMQE